jgi:hypothetical protein
MLLGIFFLLNCLFVVPYILAFPDLVIKSLSPKISFTKKLRYKKHVDAMDVITLRPNTIYHILALKSGKHGWHKVVQDPTDWHPIALIIFCTMQQGKEVPYKSVSKKNLMVKNEKIEVIFKRFSDGTIAISNAWVSREINEQEQGILYEGWFNWSRSYGQCNCRAFDSSRA